MAFFSDIGGGVKKSFGGTARFFKGSIQELKKVRWPSRREMVSYTLVVLVTVTLLAIFFFFVDWGIFEGVKWITER